jgi:hypothetical protein
LGISPSHQSDIELGRRRPLRLGQIERCTKFLGLTDLQLQDLLSAALVDRRSIDLPLDDKAPSAIDAGVALMRAWPKMSGHEHTALIEFLKELMGND